MGFYEECGDKPYEDKMSKCSQELRLEGKPYPRTCSVCSLGPCIHQQKMPEAINKFETKESKLTNNLGMNSASDPIAEFHAKQQYADFVKAALIGAMSNPELTCLQYEVMAKTICDAAEATLLEMTRRGNELSRQ